MFVFIHGGYWQMRAKETFRFLAAGPLAHGVSVAYTLAPEAGLRDIVGEIDFGLAILLGVPTGLASVIMDARTLSRADLVVTGMIGIGLAGFVTDRLIVALNNRVLRWSPQHRG